MPHYKLLFPSKYVDAGTLDGRDVTVTIESVQMSMLQREGGDSEERPTVKLVGKTKTWILNKTNAKIIAKLYGTEVDDWRGKQVTLYATTCDAFGDVVPCVRVRPTAPRQQQPTPDDAPPNGMTDDEKRQAEIDEANSY